MSIHTKTDKEGIYFITFTCCNWLPLIELSQGYNVVYNFFKVLTQQQHTVLAYVIMPNHLHLLLYYNGGKSLNTIIGNGKRLLPRRVSSGYLADSNLGKLRGTRRHRISLSCLYVNPYQNR